MHHASRQYSPLSADRIVDPGLAFLTKQHVGEGREVLGRRTDPHANRRRKNDWQFHAGQAEALAIYRPAADCDPDRRTGKVTLVNVRKDRVNLFLVKFTGKFASG